MSDSSWPDGLQPTRLLCPWDFPGKSTGVGAIAFSESILGPSQRVRHDWVTSLWLFTFMHWRRKWQFTPVFLPGESQGWGAWWAAVRGCTESETTDAKLAAAAVAGPSQVVLVVKNQPTNAEDWVPSLGGEDPLEEGMATHSSILAWRIPWTEEPARLQAAVGLHRVRHDWSDLACMQATCPRCFV